VHWHKQKYKGENILLLAWEACFVALSQLITTATSSVLLQSRLPFHVLANFSLRVVPRHLCEKNVARTRSFVHRGSLIKAGLPLCYYMRTIYYPFCRGEMCTLGTTHAKSSSHQLKCSRLVYDFVDKYITIFCFYCFRGSL